MADSEVTHVLNDLITLNKNRVTGYKEVAHELKDENIANHCREMIQQGEQNIRELTSLLHEAGGIVDDKTTTSGFIYNIWMDIVYAGEKESKEDIYDFCRRMEETTLQSYQSLLQKIGNGNANELNIVNRQMQEVRTSLHGLDILPK